MKIKSLMVLFVAFLILPVCADAKEVVFRIPQDRSVYFRSYYSVGSAYLTFRPDGTYQRIAREHMYVEESDYGKWRQADSGEITLVSEEHYRDIEAPPLSIYMWHPQAAERLPFLKEEIGKLLTGAKDTFSTEEIKAVEKYGQEDVLSRISVDYPVERITKKQLKTLLTKIDLFLEDEEKNHFHATPMRYNSRTFLLWSDGESSFNRDLEEIKIKIDDAAKTGEQPSFVYCAIDQKTFEEEASTTQEFIYFPEMNER